MSGFQIVTFQSFNKLTRSFRRPGVRLKSPFVAMFECTGRRESDVYVLTLRNRISGEIAEPNPVAMPRVIDYYLAVTTISLNAGRWRLELESLKDGLLAYRDIEVQGGGKEEPDSDHSL